MLVRFSCRLASLLNRVDIPLDLVVDWHPWWINQKIGIHLRFSGVMLCLIVLVVNCFIVRLSGRWHLCQVHNLDRFSGLLASFSFHRQTGILVRFYKKNGILVENWHSCQIEQIEDLWYPCEIQRQSCSNPQISSSINIIFTASHNDLDPLYSL